MSATKDVKTSTAQPTTASPSSAADLKRDSSTVATTKNEPQQQGSSVKQPEEQASSQQQQQQQVGYHHDHLWPFAPIGFAAPLTRWFDAPSSLDRSLWSGFDRFDHNFNELAQPLKKMEESLSMRMDWRDTDNNYQLAVDLPGVPKDSVKLDVKGRKLTVTAEQREEKKDEATGWISKSSGKTQRVLTLPANADVDGISAKCVEGQLRIVIPKKTVTPSNRAIKVE